MFVNRAGLDVSVVQLLTAGPVDCPPCLPPSAGFTYTGATSISVLAGDTYGFRLTGSHGDSAYMLQGTFSIAVNHVLTLNAATPAGIGAGQMIVLRGSDMPAALASGILFNQGGGDMAASYAFYATPNIAIARSPVGLVPGPATVRSANGSASTAPVPITVLPAFGAPVLTAVNSGACNGSTATSVSSGNTIYLLADGVDTAGSTVVWTSAVGSPISVPVGTVSGGPGSVCSWAVAPALTSGNWTLQIRSGSSPLSNGVGIIVAVAAPADTESTGTGLRRCPSRSDRRPAARRRPARASATRARGAVT